MLHHSLGAITTFSLGSLTLHWYWVLLLLGFVTSFLTCRLMQERSDEARRFLKGFLFLESALVYVAVAILVMMSTGDLSFPEALLTLFLFTWYLARNWRLDPYRALDSLAQALPAGLLLGRLGNFVTGTFYGRPTEVFWAVRFATDASGLPRHPSQIYEAILEGLLLLFGLQFLRERIRSRGYGAGYIWSAFLIGYGILRFIVGFVREPDPHFGIVALGLTLGQLLSLGIFAIGILTWFWLNRRGSKSEGGKQFGKSRSESSLCG